MSVMVWATIVTFAFVLIYIAIGFYFRRRAATGEGYFAGGRNVGLLVTSGAMAAALISGGTAMGSAALTYSSGSNWVAITAVGVNVGFIIAGLIVGAAFRKLGLNSVAEFMGVRYGNRARLISLLALGVTYVLYTTAQLKAMGIMGQFLFGWDYVPAMLFFGVVTLVYVALGGMYAVIWTDFLQAVLFMVMMAVLGTASILHFGGPTSIYQQLANLPSTAEWMWEPFGKVGFAMTFSWAFCYTLAFMPHVIVRFYTARTPDVARKSAVWAAVWFSIFCVVDYWIFAPVINLMGLSFKDIDNAFIYGVNWFFQDNGFMIGFLLSGLLAAILSSASAMIHTAATSLSYDLVHVLKMDLSDQKVVQLSRICLVVVTVVAMLLALRPLYVISRIVAESVFLLALAAGLPIIIGIIWKGASEKAVVWSILIGWTAEFIINFTPLKVGITGGWLPGIWTSLLAIVLTIILSLFLKPRENELIAFEKIHSSTTERASA